MFLFIRSCSFRLLKDITFLWYENTVYAGFYYLSVCWILMLKVQGIWLDLFLFLAIPELSRSGGMPS